MILESKIHAPVLLNLSKLAAKEIKVWQASHFFSPTLFLKSLKHEHSYKVLYIFRGVRARRT